MERVEFLLGILNQQVETWFPRCGETGTANGIEVRHGLSNDDAFAIIAGLQLVAAAVFWVTMRRA